jgi:superfamily II DNA or RNA helicase
MKLRKWQNECVNLAIKQYKANKKHFLCLATPGSGKTIMAAEVAAQLLEKDKIDFILCFSPSITVSENITYTFSRRLGTRFDGVIGAAGCSYTYQNMLFFKEDFWQILSNNRVIVIFDEIHHCAGSSILNANTWGEEVLRNIQDQASYTLSLTGTPWRSDRMPITLAKYAENKFIECNYTYGLKNAVNDGVCRSPKLVLIDNERLTITTDDKQQKTFSSFKSLLNESLVSYQSVITNTDVMRYILMQGCNKLSELRKSNKNAAGLIVASSVQHAKAVLDLLHAQFNQTAILVTYKQAQASNIIKEFKDSSVQWVVSVGMVSEGTDIPRLQVCCHLSRIKTELYFRQVLGRILRVTKERNQEAWLFTFAEPSLMDFAHRIELDLPHNDVVINDTLPELGNSMEELLYESTNYINELIKKKRDKQDNQILNSKIEIDPMNEDSYKINTLEVLGGFRQQVIETFNSPFGY